MDKPKKRSKKTAIITEAEKIFFEQFTKRQDSNNDFLLRLLLIIGGVISGYGYLLLNFEIESYEPIIVLFMLIFCELLLLIYFKVIIDEGFSFRRDQIVAFRIIRKSKLVAESEEKISDLRKTFTLYYDPLKKFYPPDNSKSKKCKLKTRNKLLIFLMPAFHNTLSSAIFLIHLLVYAAFMVRILMSNSPEDIANKQFYEISLFAMMGFTTLFSIGIVVRKQRTLKKIYIQEFQARGKTDAPKRGEKTEYEE